MVSLYNDQLELVLNRKAGVRMLEKMAAKDSKKILHSELDPGTMQMKHTTVADRLVTFKEALELEEMRLEEYQKMMEEQKEKSEKPKTEVEKE